MPRGRQREARASARTDRTGHEVWSDAGASAGDEPRSKVVQDSESWKAQPDAAQTSGAKCAAECMKNGLPYRMRTADAHALVRVGSVEIPAPFAFEARRNDRWRATGFPQRSGFHGSTSRLNTHRLTALLARFTPLRPIFAAIRPWLDCLLRKAPCMSAFGWRSRQASYQPA